MGASLLTNLHFGEAAPLRTGYVHGACQAWIKRMNGAEDFEGAFGVCDGRLQECGLISAPLPFRVSRTRIPRARNHALVILDAAVFDLNPVAQRAPRRLVETPALRGLRPGRRVPLFAIVD